VQGLLLALVIRLDRQATFDSPPQHHDPTRVAPAGEFMCALHGVEALARAHPFAFLPFPLDQPFDAGGLTQFEQVALTDLLHLEHHAFIAKSIVATHQDGTFLGGESLDHQAQAGQTVFGRTGFAALNFDIEHHTDVADPVGVQGMARTAGFSRVVANFGASLVAEQQFDGGVDVKNPVGAQGFASAFIQRGIHLCGALGQLRRTGGTLFFAATIGLVWREMGQCAAQTFITDDLVHTQYLRGDFVTP